MTVRLVGSVECFVSILGARATRGGLVLQSRGATKNLELAGLRDSRWRQTALAL